MSRDLKDILDVPLPKGFNYTFWNGDNCVNDWVRIHMETGEFNNINEARKTFHLFYDSFYNELNKRCFFIEYKGEKIATATISPSNEYGYSCIIDWLAIKKEYQGHKLSKPLIYKCLEVAKELGNNKILLHTQTHTWLAAKLYLDIGFNPFYTNDTKGWRILKTITNHDKLNKIKYIDEKQMYDLLTINVIETLDKIHKDYNYEIWYKDNRNDVFVRENDNFYYYKFYDNGRRLDFIEGYRDVI